MTETSTPEQRAEWLRLSETTQAERELMARIVANSLGEQGIPRRDLADRLAMAEAAIAAITEKQP